VSHYGASLDEKTPLLRSQEAVNKWSVKLLKLLDYEADADQGKEILVFFVFFCV